jgi:hypothetical protein
MGLAINSARSSEFRMAAITNLISFEDLPQKQLPKLPNIAKESKLRASPTNPRSLGEFLAIANEANLRGKSNCG